MLKRHCPVREEAGSEQELSQKAKALVKEIRTLAQGLSGNSNLADARRISGRIRGRLDELAGELQ